MKYFDSHTHTNYEPLKSEFNQIVNELQHRDIAINIVGCDILTSKLAIEQAKTNSLLYCSIALHPETVQQRFSIVEDINLLEQLYKQNKSKIIAIGECGLDYHYYSDDETKWKQEKLFCAQIELAKRLNLPIMMHIREAHTDAIKIISRYKEDNLTWIVHCFSGTLEDLKNYESLGCYISIGGAVTFKNNDLFREVVRQINLDYLITETDAPWLTPVPFRGKTNYPYYVCNVNEYLSELLNIPLDDLNKKIIQNVKKIFNI